MDTRQHWPGPIRRHDSRRGGFRYTMDRGHEWNPAHATDELPPDYRARRTGGATRKRRK